MVTYDQARENDTGTVYGIYDEHGDLIGSIVIEDPTPAPQNRGVVTAFTKGQRVRAVRDTESWYGTSIPKGTEATVTDPEPDSDGDIYATFSAGEVGHISLTVKASDFEPVEDTPAPLDPATEFVTVENVPFDGLRSGDVIQSGHSKAGTVNVRRRSTQPATESGPVS